MTTVEIALVGYTLLILFRNTLAGPARVPADVLEAARGMGLTRPQILWRVELPLALPAIVAGIRIAVVTTISLATVAAFITPYGLGKPIFDGAPDRLQHRDTSSPAGSRSRSRSSPTPLLVVVQRAAHAVGAERGRS